MSDDDQLLRDCKNGVESALNELVRRYEQRIFALAVRVLKEHAAAEDATTETLMKIWTKARQWRGDSSASTWIFRVAFRTILDVQKRQNRWWQRWKVVANPGDIIDETMVDADENQRKKSQLKEALSKLSSIDQAVLHFHYLEEKPIAEIAEIMGKPYGNLKTQLMRARRRLKELLEQNGEIE